MAGRKKTAPLTLAELEKQRETLNEQIRQARAKRKTNFQTAMTALAENELTGEDSLTSFDVEAVIGALLNAKERVNKDPALLEQLKRLGRSFIETAENPLSKATTEPKTDKAQKEQSDPKPAPTEIDLQTKTRQTEVPHPAESSSHDDASSNDPKAFNLPLRGTATYSEDRTVGG